MNTAETDIMNRPSLFGGGIAADHPHRRRRGPGRPGLRIADRGVGRRRPDGRPRLRLPATSPGATTLDKTVRVRNYAEQARTYAVSSTFRFANDAANGAVTRLGAGHGERWRNGDATFTVTLRASTRPSSRRGPSTAAATAQMPTCSPCSSTTATSGSTTRARLPTTPIRRTCRGRCCRAPPRRVALGSDGASLDNAGRAADLELYSLMATSADDPASSVPGDNVSDADFKAVGVATYQRPGRFCAADASWIYAIDVSTWERQPTPMRRSCSSSTSISIVTGQPDYAVYNRDMRGPPRCPTAATSLRPEPRDRGRRGVLRRTTRRTARNTVLYVCAEQLGLTGADAGKAVDVDGFAVDFYTSGTVRDTGRGSRPSSAASATTASSTESHSSRRSAPVRPSRSKFSTPVRPAPAPTSRAS